MIDTGQYAVSDLQEVKTTNMTVTDHMAYWCYCCWWHHKTYKPHGCCCCCMATAMKVSVISMLVTCYNVHDKVDMSGTKMCEYYSHILPDIPTVSYSRMHWHVICCCCCCCTVHCNALSKACSQIAFAWAGENSCSMCYQQLQLLTLLLSACPIPAIQLQYRYTKAYAHTYRWFRLWCGKFQKAIFDKAIRDAWDSPCVDVSP